MLRLGSRIAIGVGAAGVVLAIVLVLFFPVEGRLGDMHYDCGQTLLDSPPPAQKDLCGSKRDSRRSEAALLVSVSLVALSIGLLSRAVDRRLVARSELNDGVVESRK